MLMVATRRERRKNGNSFIMMHKTTFDANWPVVSQLCNNSPSYLVCQNLWRQIISLYGCVTFELYICVQWSKLLYYPSLDDCVSGEKQLLWGCFIYQIITASCFQ
jgi:hypothetical protein